MNGDVCNVSKKYILNLEIMSQDKKNEIIIIKKDGAM